MTGRKLLLQTCCAPCLTAALETLGGLRPWEKSLPQAPDYEITLLFDNPNLDDEEYLARKKDLPKVIEYFQEKGLNLTLAADRTQQRRAGWEEGASPHATAPEKGSRCAYCYAYRLQESFRQASELQLDTVATTLTLGPQKNTPLINSIGLELAKTSQGVSYLQSDFKKNGGYQRSLEISKYLGLYRQNFCGCRFSRRPENTVIRQP